MSSAIPAQEVVERALAASRADETIVLVTDESEAALRWAGNSMTTNGVSSARSWTVVSILRDGDVARVGSLASTSVDPGELETVVRGAEIAAAASEPATDAMPLIAGLDPAPDWADGPGVTGIDVFAGLAAVLAVGFDGADRLYGFAHHEVDTTWLGSSSTGVRRRFVQRTGSVEINGKRCNAGSILELLVTVGSQPHQRRLIFRGDERPVRDIGRLFENELGENGMDALPVELSYLRVQ